MLIDDTTTTTTTINFHSCSMHVTSEVQAQPGPMTTSHCSKIYYINPLLANSIVFIFDMPRMFLFSLWSTLVITHLPLFWWESSPNSYFQGSYPTPHIPIDPHELSILHNGYSITWASLFVVNIVPYQNMQSVWKIWRFSSQYRHIFIWGLCWLYLDYWCISCHKVAIYKTLCVFFSSAVFTCISCTAWYHQK